MNGGVRDYTEFQSQLLERWLSTDEVIKQFLVHNKTGEPIPDQLVNKIKKESKKSSLHWAGRNQQNATVVFPKKKFNVGDFVNVKINDCTSATLVGQATGFSKNN